MPHVVISNAGKLEEEQAELIIAGITNVIVQAKGKDKNGNDNCPPEAVAISIHDTPMSHIGVGGRSYREIVGDKSK